jgi:hypothetical protein
MALMTALAAATSLVPSAAAAQTAPDPVETKVTGIRDRFVEAVKACGVEPAFVPAVSIATNGSVISYAHKTLTIGRWEELPPPLQGFLEAWAAQEAPGQDGQALFDDLFNGFLVAHELGHWVGDWSGRWETIDSWDSELEANRFAIAFAALDQTTATGLEQKVGEFAFIRQGPGPVPAGLDERTYFDDNYDALSTRDPVGYSWFQGRLMQLAWEQRADAAFCELVKLPPDLASGHSPAWTSGRKP